MNEIGTIIKQLEEQKAAIERAISALSDISKMTPMKAAVSPKTVVASVAASTSSAAAPKKRHMSAEGRKRIADAARRRWAAYKKGPNGDKKKPGKKAAKGTEEPAETND